MYMYIQPANRGFHINLWSSLLWVDTNTHFLIFLYKDKWIGLLHHVCNKHEWGLNEKCDHDEGSHDPDLPWFDRRDKDFAELQKVVLNAELLESFKYYVRFR